MGTTIKNHKISVKPMIDLDLRDLDLYAINNSKLSEAERDEVDGRCQIGTGDYMSSLLGYDLYFNVVINETFTVMCVNSQNLNDILLLRWVSGDYDGYVELCSSDGEPPQL